MTVPRISDPGAWHDQDCGIAGGFPHRASGHEPYDVCNGCGLLPGHRFGLSDPDHAYDATACVDALRRRVAELEATLARVVVEIEAGERNTPYQLARAAVSEDSPTTP